MGLGPSSGVFEVRPLEDPPWVMRVVKVRADRAAASGGGASRRVEGRARS